MIKLCKSLALSKIKLTKTKIFIHLYNFNLSKAFLFTENEADQISIELLQVKQE